MSSFSGVNSSNYETYIETWNADSMAALEAMKITPGMTVDIAFADFSFTWGGPDYKQPMIGGLNISVEQMQKMIAIIHAKGGRVKLSMGGATYPLAGKMQPMNPKGMPIGEMANFISESIKFYGLDGIDFDLEDRFPSPAAAGQFAESVAQMISQIKGANPDTEISLTLQGQDWGPNSYAKTLLDLTLPNDLVSKVNFMEYNIWVDSGNGVTYAQQIQKDLELYTGDKDKTYMGHAGWGIPADKIVIGLMPGKDDMGHDLSLVDAQALANWARQKGFGGMMTWSLNRDYEGQDGEKSFAYMDAILSANESDRFNVLGMTPKKR